MLTKEEKEFLETYRKLFETIIPLKKELSKEEEKVVIQNGRVVRKPKDVKKEIEQKKTKAKDILDKMSLQDIDEFINKQKNIVSRMVN